MTEIAARVASGALDETALAHCPGCHTPLYRYMATRARIELDACAMHGIWFDRGELGKLATQLAVERAYAPGAAAPKGGHLAAAAAFGAAGVGTAAIAYGLRQRVGADESRAEVAGAVVDVGGTVLEGALSVLGSILEGLG